MDRLVVYRRAPSLGASHLTQQIRSQLDDRRCLRLRHTSKIRDSDFVICWGDYIEGHENAINNLPIISKLEELRTLRDSGVPTVEFAETLEQVNGEGVWLPRSKYHSRANDFVTPPVHPYFYTKKEEFEYEARFHVWAGQSVRAGVKEPVPNETPHAWIRSRRYGWYINYGRRINSGLAREAAKAGVASLGLLFGAVDVGILSGTGHALVLEVNRAPGLEGNTLKKYSQKILEEYHGRNLSTGGD